MLSVAKRQSFAISCKLWRKHSLFCPFAIRFKTQELLFAGPLWSTAYQLVSHMFDRPAPFLVIFTPKKSLQCWLCARDIIGSLPLGQCSHCFSGTWTSLDFWKDPNIGEPSFKEKPQKHTYRPQKPQESDQFCFQCTTYKKIRRSSERKLMCPSVPGGSLGVWPTLKVAEGGSHLGIPSFQC